MATEPTTRGWAWTTWRDAPATKIPAVAAGWNDRVFVVAWEATAWVPRTRIPSDPNQGGACLKPKLGKAEDATTRLDNTRLREETDTRRAARDGESGGAAVWGGGFHDRRRHLEHRRR